MENLTIIYRDELGIVSVTAPDMYLLDGKLYFTTTDGRDYTIPVESLVSVHAV